MNNTLEKAALYKVENTGYYCVALIPTTLNTGANNTYFEAWIEWKFPYGELPAVDYPKLLVNKPINGIFKKKKKKKRI